jgi:hypothetical protein
MKDFRGIKRQRSRNRKPAGNQSNPNRAYESNGPDGAKVRGNAQTIYEKYQQLARDANSSGDRVLAENHLQHAEHYFRLIRQTQPQRPISEYVQRDPFMNGLDFDYDEETDQETTEQPEVEAASETDEASSEERNERWRDRNDRNRERNDRNDRNRDRNDRNRDRDRDQNRDQNRDNAPRDNVSREVRADNDRDMGDGEGGNRRETRRERYERRRQQRLTEQEVTLNTVNGTNGAINGGGFGPSSLTSNTPAPFIASTEPLGATPSRLDQPVEAPARREKAPEPTADAAQLPAFLRTPVVVAEAPINGSVNGAADEPAEAPKKTRRPRKKAEDAVGASEEA